MSVALYTWRSLRMSLWLGLFFLLAVGKLFAHPSPNSKVIFHLNPHWAEVELQLPISELSLAFSTDILQDPEHIVAHYQDRLERYILAHTHAYQNAQHPWNVDIVSMRMDKSMPDAYTSPFWEVIVHLRLTPKAGETTRWFTFDYDAIVHQVVNHTVYVAIKSDWENGVFNEEPTTLATIRWDAQTNTIPPLLIHLGEGNSWKGFVGMVRLGAQHIREGVDHLLFIITLLLPSCLLVTRGRWSSFGGLKYTLMRLLSVVTAFTIGHSLTLCIGAFDWFRMPLQWVEVLIAVSIFISSIHAIRPIFYGKEMFVALGFGFVHGLAFSQTLIDLTVDTSSLIWSILGFNLGIELMQLLIILLVIPWFMLLGKINRLAYLRVFFALLVACMSVGWIVQQITSQDNVMTQLSQVLFLDYAYLFILCLAVLSLGLFFFLRYRKIRFKIT